MTKGLFATLSAQLQAAHVEQEYADLAAIQARRQGIAALVATAEATKAVENVKCARLGAALAAIPPDTASDALRLVSLASSWAQILGDAIGDDSSVETEYQNLTAALDGLTAHLLAAVPKAERKPAVLGFTAYLGHVAERLFPREYAALRGAMVSRD